MQNARDADRDGRRMWRSIYDIIQEDMSYAIKEHIISYKKNIFYRIKAYIVQHKKVYNIIYVCRYNTPVRRDAAAMPSLPEMPPGSFPCTASVHTHPYPRAVLPPHGVPERTAGTSVERGMPPRITPPC